MTSSPTAPDRREETDRDNGYATLLAATGSWFGFWGVHMVLYQWLVVEVLAATPTEVGWAQTAMTLPSLFFLLLTGVVADRLDPSRLMLAIHCATAVVTALLALAIGAGALTYTIVLVYAVSLGVLQAFGFPPRDALLSAVVRGSMSRAVAGTTLTQHSAQMVGAFLAGTASLFGAVPVLAFQGLLVAAGALPLLRLPRRRRSEALKPISLHELRAGVVEVAHSPVLRPVMLLSIVTGLLYVGPYLVIIPLMVRDVYGGDASELAVLNAMFPLGSVIGGLWIVWRGGLRRSGRALALGQLTASLCVGILSLELPFGGAVLAVLGWGVSGALFINAGRTLFQSHASEANRARVLSVYTLGVMGGAPIGSLATGFLVVWLGLRGTLALDAALALAVILTVIATTALWRLR